VSSIGAHSKLQASFERQRHCTEIVRRIIDELIRTAPTNDAGFGGEVSAFAYQETASADKIAALSYKEMPSPYKIVDDLSVPELRHLPC
jgi:hypothetical protein